MRKSGKIILFAVAVILVFCGTYRLIFPPLGSSLANSSWCVDNVYFNGMRMGPRTLHAIYLVAKGKKSCTDVLSFMDEGDIQLPGLNTRAIEGSWQIDKDKNLQLSVDTLQDVYQGNYKVYFSADTLVLKSKTTLIEAHQ